MTAHSRDKTPATVNWRRLSISDSIKASRTGSAQLKPLLGRLDLTAMGVGAIVGAGIFVMTGVAAATKAGPAIVLSFVLAGAVCVLVALCYGELSAMVPISGSAYTYTYATLGEVPGFLVGWNLILECVVACAAVALGWSGMFSAALRALFGVTLPVAISAAPAEGGLVNLPAIAIVVVVTAVLAGNVRLTAWVTKVLVALTVGALVLIVAIGLPHIQLSNWVPFAPFGAKGVLGGAALAFFSFLGFDIVATSAEESRRPRRDLPFGIIATVLVGTVLYVAVSGVLTGIVPYTELNSAAPVATAFSALHVGWIGGVIFAASVAALTKGLLIVGYGQSRLVFAMCRDGLLPARWAHISPRTGTPVRLTVLLGAAGAAMTGFVSMDVVAELVNLGALTAFALVSVGVVVLRVLEPQRDRPFRVPLMPVVPILAVIGCIVLATALAWITWLWFGLWLLAGLVMYAVYGRRHSALASVLSRDSCRGGSEGT